MIHYLRNFHRSKSSPTSKLSGKSSPFKCSYLRAISGERKHTHLHHQSQFPHLQSHRKNEIRHISDLQACSHLFQQLSEILQGCHRSMILILPHHRHLLESSAGVQLAFENAPLRPCSSAAGCPAFVSSQAGPHSPNERVAFPSRQVVFHCASQVTDVADAEAVSLPSSQTTQFAGVEVLTSVARACSTLIVFQVSSPTGLEPQCGALLARRKVGTSSDPPLRRNWKLSIPLSAFLFPFDSYLECSSFCPERLKVLPF